MVIHPDLGKLSSESEKNFILITDLMEMMQKEVDKFEKIDSADKKNSRYKDAGIF